MQTINLNRKENFKRAEQFVSGVKNYPTELIRINYSFDVLTSHFEKITHKEIDFIIKKTLDFIKKNLGQNFQKTGIVVFPDFVWDANQFVHTVGINFVLTGKNIGENLKKLQFEIARLVREVIGGEFNIAFIEDNTKEDVFIEVFPVQFDTILKDIDWFFTSSNYPKFYSRPLFDFITSPLTLFQTETSILKQ